MASIKTSTLVFHILGWLGFLSLPLMFVVAMFNNSGNNTVLSILANGYYWYCFIVFATAFYLHSYWLFPQLFLNKKYVLYGLVVAVMFAAVFFLKPFDTLISSLWPQRFTNEMNRPPQPADRSFEPGDNRPPPPPPGNFNGRMMRPGRQHPRVDIISILFFLLMIGIGVANVTNRRWQEAMEKAARAEADKANAELSFLKAQINPHFLFNTLNNIYSLAVIKDDNTADSIMKLSNIMRYITDDGLENYVSLQNEVDCITDYIDLQRLRLGSKVQLDFEVNGRLEGKTIAPLILISFIENVFKYGLSNNEHSVIVIKIFAEEKSITFYSENKLFPKKQMLERTGIGITNTQKRLQYLYPNKHLLNITEDDGKYIVQLTLQL